jgi:hypothetical protein
MDLERGVLARIDRKLLAGLGVDRIRRAPLATVLTIRTVHLNHLDTRGAEMTGEICAIRPGALHSDPDNRTKRAATPRDADSRPRSPGTTRHRAGHRAHGVLLRHTHRRVCPHHQPSRYHRHDRPFLSPTGGRGGTRHRDGGPRGQPSRCYQLNRRLTARPGRATPP